MFHQSMMYIHLDIMKHNIYRTLHNILRCQDNDHYNLILNYRIITQYNNKLIHTSLLLSRYKHHIQLHLFQDYIMYINILQFLHLLYNILHYNLINILINIIKCIYKLNLMYMPSNKFYPLDYNTIVHQDIKIYMFHYINSIIINNKLLHHYNVKDIYIIIQLNLYLL